MTENTLKSTSVPNAVSEEEEVASVISSILCFNSENTAKKQPDLEKSSPETIPQKDPFEVHWDGVDDAENIRNASLLRRWIYAIIISCSSIVITCTSSIYSMAVDGITTEFGKSHTVTILGITFFLLGMGWGPVFLAPISEFHGRRIVYICSFLFMLPFQILTGFAPNMTALLIGRFLAGFSGSAFMGVASGSFSDMFEKDEIILPVMMYTLTPFSGPGLGPLIGGFIVSNLEWRWTNHVMAIAIGVMLTFILLIVPESYAPVLLRKKAVRLRKQTGDDRYYAPIERSKKSLIDTILLSCKRPMQMLVYEPMLTLLCIYSGLLLSLLYLFFVSYPYVFRTVYLFDDDQVGLAFIGLLIGCLAAAPTALYCKKYVNKQIAANNGVYEPELQLPQTIIGSLIVPIGLFIFAWTSYPHVHWIGPIIGGGIIVFGLVIAYNGIFAFTIDAYRLFAASAMACNGVVRSTMGSVFPLFGLQMYQSMGIQWATSLLAFLCIAFIPMPIAFWKYGARIRAKSKFAWSEDY